MEKIVMEQKRGLYFRQNKYLRLDFFLKKQKNKKKTGVS